MSELVATWLRRVRDRLSGGETGDTIIEVIVAAALAVMIIGGAAELFAESNDSALGSQRQAQLLAVADQQIEQIREQVKTAGFAALAMNGAPSSGTNSTVSYSPTSHTDPNDFVSSVSGCGTSNAGYLIEANYNDTTEGVATGVAPWPNCTTGAEPLVVAAGGIVTPKQTITFGSATATVYTYVTDTYVGCAVSPGIPCTGSNTTGDARRVIVAVVPSNGGRNNIGPNAPAFVSTIFTNPVPTNQINSSIGLTLGLSIG